MLCGYGVAADGCGTSRDLWLPVVLVTAQPYGEFTFSPDDEPLDQKVHRLLAERPATVAVAESITGGLLAAALTDMPGASTTFRGSITAYATELKAELLGVDPQLLARHGPVHPEVARQMATGVRDRLRATYGVATTGVAGPAGQDDKPVGEVHVAVVGPDADSVVSTVLPGDRDTVRRGARALALDLLRRVLEHAEQ